jgi:hypothetical protein
MLSMISDIPIDNEVHVVTSSAQSFKEAYRNYLASLLVIVKPILMDVGLKEHILGPTYKQK